MILHLLQPRTGITYNIVIRFSLKIYRASFEANRAHSISTIMFLNADINEGSIIQDCEFIKNDGDRLMLVSNSKLEIKNTVIDGNFGTESAKILSTEATIKMSGNTFDNQACKDQCYL